MSAERANAAESSYPSVGAARYALAVLVIATILAFLDRQVLSLLVGPVRHDLQITDTQVSLLQGVAFVVLFAIAGLPIGRIVDRWNRRNLLLIAILVWSAMSIACGTATNFWQLFAARSGVGIGEACLLPASYSLVSDLFRFEHRGRAAGILGIGMSLGAGASFIVAAGMLHLMSAATRAMPLLGNIASWRLMFVGCGFLGLPMALLILTVPEPARRETTATMHDPLDSRADFTSYLRRNSRVLVPIAMASAAVVFAASGAVYWGPTSLMRRFNLPAAQIGFSFGLATLSGGLLGPLLGGIATDRWIASGHGGGRLMLFLVSVPVAIAGISLLSFCPKPLWCYFGVSLSTLGTSSLVHACYTATQDLCPNQYRGGAIALISLANNLIGVTLGPLAVSLVTQHVFAQDYRLSASLGIVTIPILTAGMLTALAVIASKRPSEPVASKTLGLP